MYYNLFFIIQFILTTDFIEAFSLPENSGPSPCHLPTGRPALCVPFTRCTQIKALIENLNKPLPGDVSLYIRDSFFCTSGKGTEVCCDVDSIVPPINEKPTHEKKEGCLLQNPRLEGVCSPFNECIPFLQMLSNLNRPLSPEIPKIMRAGLLCGIKNKFPYICCPKAAVDAFKKKTTPKPTTPTKPTQSTTEQPTTTDKVEETTTKEEVTTQKPDEQNTTLDPSKSEALKKFESHANWKLLPSLEKCGSDPLIKERVLGGQNASLGQFPWLANLGYSKGNSQVSFKCGGSLINERFVLTAAHCVTNIPGGFKLVRVRLGEHNLLVNPDCTMFSTTQICAPDVQDFDIEKIIPHESYNAPNPFQNDIALLKLDRKPQFSEYVYPICLPFEDAQDEGYHLIKSRKNPINTLVAGWGATDRRGRKPAQILQFLNINVTDAEQCRDLYKTRGGLLTPLQQMCAGGEEGKDSCVGDSGSSLMRENGKVPSSWKIIGIVSFGPRLCGTKGIPGVYTRTRYYLDWILDNLEA